MGELDVGTAVVGHPKELGVAGPGGEAPLSGVVAVVDRTPVCTCGWSGRRRVAVFLARHDAWMHAVSAGCQPGVPFVR